jgi:hypothetical protein
MDVTDAIKKGWAAVEESGVPEHMQKLAFREVLRTLLGTAHPASKQSEQPVGGGAKPVRDEDSGDTTTDEETVIAAVSEHTGVPAEKLEKVFHLDNSTVKLLVNHSSLGSNAADKTRAAAQIITVIRKIGMGQSETAFDVIRQECERKHFYDSKHFANTHLSNIEGFAVKGEGRNKQLEARNAGIEAFSALIDKVLGSS